MLIIYDSLTGNVQRFINRLDYPSMKIKDGLLIKEPFILVTYTTGFGELPQSTEKFLLDNYSFLQAVAVSGNKNWGSFFGRAGEIISERYDAPLLLKFELSGMKKDVDKFNEEVMRIDTKTIAKLVEI